MEKAGNRVTIFLFVFTISIHNRALGIYNFFEVELEKTPGKFFRAGRTEFRSLNSFFFKKRSELRKAI